MYRRQSRRGKRQAAKVEINVVPYIDVMLVLLIVFMITAPLITQGVKVTLPQALAQKISLNEAKPLVVTVNEQGQYFLNRNDVLQPLTKDELFNEVKTIIGQNSRQKVYVRGDKNANYGQVVGAMVLLQKSGVASVGLVTNDKQK